jgi:hypothetical protein
MGGRASGPNCLLDFHCRPGGIPRQGYYSIVQYCPDPSRLEAVNIGVVLFCPEQSLPKVRFGRPKTRVDQLFGKQDWEFVESQKAAIEARLAVSRTLSSAWRTLNPIFPAGQMLSS